MKVTVGMMRVPKRIKTCISELLSEFLCLAEFVGVSPEPAVLTFQTCEVAARYKLVLRGTAAKNSNGQIIGKSSIDRLGTARLCIGLSDLDVVVRRGAFQPSKRIQFSCSSLWIGDGCRVL